MHHINPEFLLLWLLFVILPLVPGSALNANAVAQEMSHTRKSKYQPLQKHPSTNAILSITVLYLQIYDICLYKQAQKCSFIHTINQIKVVFPTSGMTPNYYRLCDFRPASWHGQYWSTQFWHRTSETSSKSQQLLHWSLHTVSSIPQECRCPVLLSQAVRGENKKPIQIQLPSFISDQSTLENSSLCMFSAWGT